MRLRSRMRHSAFVAAVSVLVLLPVAAFGGESRKVDVARDATVRDVPAPAPRPVGPPKAPNAAEAVPTRLEDLQGPRRPDDAARGEFVGCRLDGYDRVDGPGSAIPDGVGDGVLLGPLTFSQPTRLLSDIAVAFSGNHEALADLAIQLEYDEDRDGVYERTISLVAPGNCTKTLDGEYQFSERGDVFFPESCYEDPGTLDPDACYLPRTPLSALRGLWGGGWFRLRVVDAFSGYSGSIGTWSVFATTSCAVDLPDRYVGSGGSIPGSGGGYARGGSLVTEITTSPGSTIETLTIGLDVTHSWLGDLEMSIAYDRDDDGVIDVGPVLFQSGNSGGGSRLPPGSEGLGGGCSSNLCGLYFFDAGATEVLGDVCPTFADPGCFLGAGLDVFHGEPLGGRFVLTVQDTYPAEDDGTLNAWQVIVERSSCPSDPADVLTSDSDVPIPDADPSGVTTTIDTPNGGTIADVSVELSMEHTWVGDLIVEIGYDIDGDAQIDVGPVKLLCRPEAEGCLTSGPPYGCAADLDGTFRFDASQSVPLAELACASSQSTYGSSCYAIAPESAHGLEVFDGLPLGGTFRLTLIDAAAGDTGVLRGWSLDILRDECELANDHATYADPTEYFINPVGTASERSNPIAIPAGVRISDVVVDVDLEHTWLGDLNVELGYDSDGDGVEDVGPVTLIARPGVGETTFGCPADVHGVLRFTEDVDGADPIGEDVCLEAYGGGCYRIASSSPYPLSVFDGVDGGGSFYLTMSDEADLDGGSWSWKIAVIETPAPNLQPLGFEVAPEVLRPGDPIGAGISLTVWNDGVFDVPGDVSVGLYLSTNTAITTSDVLLTNGRVAISDLYAGETRVVDFPSDVAVPVDYQQFGAVYLGVIVDDLQQLAESNEGDNTAFDAAQMVSFPDFVIESLTIDPESPRTDGEILISATIQNLGGPSPDAVVLRILDGNDASPDVWDFVIGPLAAGAKESRSATTSHPDPGSYTATARADPLDALPEQQEDNNEATVDYQVAGVPDLVVESIQVSPDQPTTTDPIEVTVTVRNVGNAPSMGGAIRIEEGPDGGAPTTSVELPLQNLAPGVMQQLVLEPIDHGAAGSYCVVANADISDDVDESDEENNDRSVCYSIGGVPDLVVESLELDAQSPTVGSELTLTAMVRNVGEAPAGTFDVALTDGVETSEQTSVSSLGVNESVEVTLIFTPDEPGSFTASATADVNANVVEFDEKNNGAELGYVVADLPDLAIETIVVTPANPTTADQIDIDVSVTNLRMAAAGSFQVEIRDGDEGAGEGMVIPVGSLGGGETIGLETRTVAHATPGSYDVVVVIDGNHQVDELDESNNLASQSYTVAAIADLLVEDLEVVPAEPFTGVEFLVRLTVRNAGSGGAGPFQTEIGGGGATSSVLYPSVSLAAGGTLVLEHPVVQSTPGEYLAAVAIDVTNAVPESDETNNEGSLTYVVAGRPDLVVSEITLDPLSPIAGETFDIVLTVRNQGDAAADACVLEVLVEGQTVDRLDVPALTAGATTEPRRATIHVDPGVYTVDATIDIDGVVAEANESNNTFSYDYAVAGIADLVVQSIAITPPSPTTEQSASIGVVIANIGTTTARNFVVEIERSGPSGTTTVERSIEELTAGATDSSIDVMLDNDVPGEYLATVRVDAYDAVEESDEGNNQSSEPYAVSGVPDVVVDGVAVSPPAPTVGQDVDIVVSLRNAGTAATGSFDVLVTDDGDPGVRLEVEDLQPGATTSVVRTVSPDAPGAYVAAATADVDDVVSEIREDNNAGSTTYSVGGVPDLTASITLFPPSPTVLDPIDIEVTVSNVGNAEAAASQLRIMNGNEIETRALGALPPGGSVIETWTIPAVDAPGELIPVSALADAGGAVTELDEENNLDEDDYVRADVPDLVVDSLEVVPELPTTLDVVLVSAFVRNARSVPAPSFVVELRDDDDPPGEGTRVTVESLGANETVEVSRAMNHATAGSFTAHVDLDVDEDVAEASELNNDASIVYIVADVPDLEVSLSISPTSPTPDDAIDIRAVVRNVGAVDSPAFAAELRDDGEPEGGGQITNRPGLAPGDSTTIVRTVPSRPEGTYAVHAAVDPDDLIGESSETNNEETLVFDVVRPLLSISGGAWACDEPACTIAGLPLALVALGGGEEETSTDANGAFSFTALEPGPYQLTVAGAPAGDDPLEGISALDARQILLHLVDAVSLDDCALEAADVNASGAVSQLDARRILLRLVGTIDGFAAGAFRSIPALYDYDPLATDASEQNFEVVKVGDVNLGWCVPITPARESGSATGEIDVVTELELDRIVIEVAARSVGIGIVAPELVLALPAGVEVDSVACPSALLSAWGHRDGTVRAAAFYERPVAPGEWVVVARMFGRLSSGLSAGARIQVPDQQWHEGALAIRGDTFEIASPGARALTLRAPSPVSAGQPAEVTFTIPRHRRMQELSVYDISGRRIVDLLPLVSVAADGVGSVQWDLRHPHGGGWPAGVYFVRLTTEQQSRSGKIVVVR